MCQRGILRRVRSTAQPYGGKYREWPWDVAPLCVLWRRIRTYGDLCSRVPRIRVGVREQKFGTLIIKR